MKREKPSRFDDIDLEDEEQPVPKQRKQPSRRLLVRKGGKLVEINRRPSRESR